MTRRAGVVIPLFSIRNRGWGVGEIPDLAPFSQWAASAGFTAVQILPVNEPSGGQHSPYAALTAFALDPVYLAVDQVEDFTDGGGLDALPTADREAIERLRDAREVAWEEARRLKIEAMWRAYRHFAARHLGTASARGRAFDEYVRAHAHWLEDYALFAAIHDDHRGASWQTWEPPLRDRVPDTLDEARRRHADAIQYRRYVQWQLDEQWRRARRAAEAAGVELMGDLPFMVAGDSADVWARTAEFDLESRLGVPPDAFSADGQDWGLPVYRWDVMAANDFAWLRARAERAAETFGFYRVDHVVGLYRTFYRPKGGPSAGAGMFTPEREEDQTHLGERLLRILGGGDARRVVAEDLGVVPDFVRASLARLGIPGYRVLRWEKDGDVFRDPTRWPAVSVGTSGTHDTESMADWYDALSDAERARLLELPVLERLRDPWAARFDDRVRDALLELLYRSGSDLLLIPYQDLFGLRERINLPGTVSDDNWTYRMPTDLTALRRDEASAARLAWLAAETDRRP